MSLRSQMNGENSSNSYQNTSQPKPSTDLETQKRILNVLENLESNHEKTTLNLSNEDKLYITRLTERIKRSNEHKINIEIDDKLGKLIQQKIDKNLDKKIPDFHSTQTMERFKQSLLSIEQKQERLDDSLESVHKWSMYFKSLLMLSLFAVLFIGVVGTFMGGIFNALGVQHVYQGLEYQIKHSEGFVAFLWHLGYIIPYLMLAGLIWLLFALNDKFKY